MDSNHRRRSRRIYSPLHLAALQSSLVPHNGSRNLLMFWFLSRLVPLNGSRNLLMFWFLSRLVPRAGIEPATCKRFTCVSVSIRLSAGASSRNRTSDTRIFSPLLYRLSYRGITLAIITYDQQILLTNLTVCYIRQHSFQCKFVYRQKLY